MTDYYAKIQIKQFESHPRQWEDRSSPAYRNASARPLGIPPTAVGGSFKSSLPQRERTTAGNPTHGSGWIVQVQPTATRAHDAGNPTHGSGRIVQVQPKRK